MRWINHPKGRNGALVIRQRLRGGWQCWRPWAHHWSGTSFGPSDFDVRVVEWEDTWCEPEAED